MLIEHTTFLQEERINYGRSCSQALGNESAYCLVLLLLTTTGEVWLELFVTGDKRIQGNC